MLSTNDLTNIARGFLMGGADIIPGVSGGTVALILGIYERLVTAVSRFDLTLLSHVRHLRFRAAAEHIDLRFLLSLASGIALGILGLATLMHYLLENQLQYTFAAFFGLILASSLLVGQMVQRWDALSGACLAIGAAAAYVLVGLPFTSSPPEGNGYVFVCGTVGICAMILPGISGAFILLVLGKYSEITEVLRNTMHGEITVANVTTIAVFCAGCAVGLLSFSKLLRWLLARHESQTMALLCGFMVGSLRKIWPFKHDLTPDVRFKEKQFANILPKSIDGDVLLTVAIAVAAAAFVIVLDRLTKAHEHVPPLSEEEVEEQS